MSAPEEEAGRGEAFRLLFDYISGANRASDEVAMTAPVATEAADGGYRDALSLPSSYTPASAPEPTAVLAVDFVFARRDIFVDSEKWLRSNREAIIGNGTEEDG